MNKETDYIKQVIVIRKDLYMPTGKVAAMAAHAAMTFITERIGMVKWLNGDNDDMFARFEGVFTETEAHWLVDREPGSDTQTSFAKIVLQVHSEEELQEVYDAAKAAGLEVHKVVDGGYSHNKPNTFVAIAIGPDYPAALEPVTGHLELYR